MEHTLTGQREKLTLTHVGFPVLFSYVDTRKSDNDFKEYGFGTWDDLRPLGMSNHKSSSILHPPRQEERGP